jgi:hypothetical protein
MEKASTKIIEEKEEQLKIEHDKLTTALYLLDKKTQSFETQTEPHGVHVGSDCNLFVHFSLSSQADSTQNLNQNLTHNLNLNLNQSRPSEAPSRRSSKLRTTYNPMFKTR